MNFRFARCIGTVFLTLGLVAAAAQAQGNCDGFSKKQRLTKLGGTNSFSTSVSTIAELQAAFEANRDDIMFLLETQGLIDAAPAVFDAVRRGDVTERNLNRGESFKWMAYRYKGKPRVTDNRCIDTDDGYGTFELVVTLGDQPEKGECLINATADCEFRSETASVDASGSSPGVSVTMSGDGNTTTVIPSGAGPTWQGSMPSPYNNTYTFTASAKEGPKSPVRQLTFVIPKVCLNFALISDEEVMMPAPGCSESVTLSCPVTAPSCSITVDNENPWTGEDTDVRVSGTWPGNEIAVEVLDANGNTVAEPLLSPPFPNTVSFSKPGEYTLSGTATNEIGETATCTAGVSVDGRWTLRPLIHYADPGSDTASVVRAATPPFVQERSFFNADSGYGAEIALEYHINDRVGIEGRLSYSIFDSLMEFDIDTAWDMQNDDFGVMSLTVGPDFHLTPSSRVDFFVTPVVGYASVNGTSYNLLGRNFDLDFDNQFVWGVALGLDVPLGQATPWNLSFSARYQDLDAESDDYSVALDPFFLGAGFAYDF
ncbi:MAG: porin family protein [Thermoanaerobaculia bacterium]|nr:porin family protein [Thermoanaerobaculia bacterium]